MSLSLVLWNLTKLLQFGLIPLVLNGNLHQQPDNLSDFLGTVSWGTLQIHSHLVISTMYLNSFVSLCIFLLYALRCS